MKESMQQSCNMSFWLMCWGAGLLHTSFCPEDCQFLIYRPAAEHHGTKCSKKKKKTEASPIPPTSRPFLLLWQQQGQEEATLDAGQLCVDTTLVSSQRLSAYSTDSHLAAIPSVVDRSKISAVKLFNWRTTIWSLAKAGCSHSDHRSC